MISKRNNNHIRIRAILPFFAVFLMACDETPKPKPAAATSASPVASAAPAPEPSKPPQLAVDDTAAFISGERIDLAAPDPAGRYATVLGSKPKVAGEDLVLEAARTTLYPKIALIAAAAMKANAKSLTIHTPKRDRTTGDVVVVMKPKSWSDCSAVGFISKDSSATAQTAAGRNGARFTKGMAGPDLTRTSEGIRKVMAGCDSSVWAASAEPEITWGVVADMIWSVQSPDDGGTAPKAHDVALLSKSPGGGHKAEE